MAVDYTFEELISPKVYKMQSGNKPFPIAKFVNTYNEVLKIMRSDNDFYNQISTAFETADEINAFAKLSGKFADQGQGLLLNLRSSGLPVHMPNVEYFSKAYNSLMNTTQPNSAARKSQTRALCKQYVEALTASVDKNLENSNYIDKIK